jgi:hypothetical protein
MAYVRIRTQRESIRVEALMVDDKSDKVTAPRVRQVFTRLPPDLVREVQAAAAEELLSVSSFCRRAIANAVRTQKAA